MICKLVKAGHKSPKLVRYIAGKSVGLTADFGFGKFRLPRNRTEWAIQALCSFHANSRAAEVRHIVFSTPKEMEKKEAQKLLRAVCADWLKAYASGRNWIFGLHEDNGIQHGHLAVANLGPDSKPLKFRPHQVLAMSDMAFTKLASPAKGKGKRGLPLYTKARKKLVVQDLASLLIAPDGSLRQEIWDQFKAKKLLTKFRTRNDGSIISFEFQDKRIRYTTLLRFLKPKHPTNQQPMPQTFIQPNQALPEDLGAKLLNAGFSKKDLASINAKLRSANAEQEKDIPKETPSINHPEHFPKL